MLTLLRSLSVKVSARRGEEPVRTLHVAGKSSAPTRRGGRRAPSHLCGVHAVGAGASIQELFLQLF